MRIPNLVAALPFLLLLAAAPAPAGSDEGRSGGISVGERMEDFRLKDVRTGRPTSLYAYAGDQAVAVVVMATRCPYSNAYNAILADLPARYRGRPVKFLGINPNRTEPPAEVAEHARRHGIGFPVLEDEGQKVVDRLGARVTPEVFLVAGDRTLVYHGALGNSAEPTADAAVANSNELDAALEAHLAGRKVPQPENQPFGCSIKR